jgi:hypothetical protein
MRNFYLAGVIAIALISIVLPEQPHALTLTLSQNSTTAFPTTGGYQAPNFTQGVTQVDNAIGSLTNVYRTPWDDLAPYDTTLRYTSVRNGTAGYNMTGTSLSLFWGSVDTYNTLTFYTQANAGGTGVAFNTSLLGSPTGSGHHLVTILTDFTFKSVTLFSSQAAFEFAQLAATPLPAALPLFATGLGLMGWFARRRKGRGRIAAPLAA